MYFPRQQEKVLPSWFSGMILPTNEQLLMFRIVLYVFGCPHFSPFFK
jgi:hypothetical protein